MLQDLRDGKKLNKGQLLWLIVTLSMPTIMAQISSIVMQYIDAAMVGHLGPGESAAIGLMASSTWMVGSVCQAVSIGFTVQIAHAIGAKDGKTARQLVKEGIIVGSAISLVVLAVGVALHGGLPAWLGGEEAIRKDASTYFLIYSLSIPALLLNNMAAGMLQCSGNMKVPSVLETLMCLLDVVFNRLLIFPTGQMNLLGLKVTIPGAGLGVAGAALGTALSVVVITLCMLYFVLVRSEDLRIREREIVWNRHHLTKAVRMATPVAFEQIIMCGAYIFSTKIVAPLGMIAMAAHSFSITAESLCYMPGYGIGAAATTLIGQSIGAKRKDLTRKLAWMCTGFGMLIMTGSGLLMYLLAPWMIGLLSPDAAIRALGTQVLRMEAFAEPFYAASIVATGALRGAGDTLAPSIMNFVSMWLIRLPLSVILARSHGLVGVWMAMRIELWARGVIFLLRMAFKKWYEKNEVI